jgi:phenylpropionate dioxygenase-like ring-hydroxylating dioxygenase large terminal subunit
LVFWQSYRDHAATGSIGARERESSMLLTNESSDAPAPRVAGHDLRKTGIDPNFWYPLARSHELKPGKAIGVSFAGEPIALVRPRDGSVFALEDRCAHRQVPLHAGVVNGPCLQCCYHGWTYDSTGRCVTVPYLGADRALPNGVRSYPCREAHGLIFVFPGEAVARAADTFPDLSRQADPRYKTRYLDRSIACHYSFMHENLMDMNHQFLHRRLMGRIRTTFLDLRRTADRVEVDYTFSRMEGSQSLGERFMVGAKRKRPADARGGKRNVMTIATEYPYQRLRFWPPETDEPALDLWNVYVPLDRAQRTNRTFGLMMIKKPSLPGLIHLMWPAIAWFTDGIFAEDKDIVEKEQQAFDAQGADRNHEIFPVIQALRAHLIEKGVPLPLQGGVGG